MPVRGRADHAAPREPHRAGRHRLHDDRRRWPLPVPRPPATPPPSTSSAPGYAGIEYFASRCGVPGARGHPDRRLGHRRRRRRSGSAEAPDHPPADASGSRAVLDLLSIRNDGPDTRIGRDSLSPSWQVILPAGALQVGGAGGRRQPERGRGSAATRCDVLAPIAPGVKNMMVSYRLPVGARPTGVDRRRQIHSIVLVEEERRHRAHGAGLAPAAPVELMGSTLRRWTASPPTGGAVEVEFAGGSAALGRLLYWLVGAGGGGPRRPAAAWAFGDDRGTRSPAAIAAPGRPGRRDRAARRALRGEPRARCRRAEWAAYEAERARLKAAALARRRTHR